MFTPEERAALRQELIAQAQADPRITGGAVTGSASEHREDDLSDIDLAFGVSPHANFGEVVADFTESMFAEHGAVHHLDVNAGSWLYRVFLLSNTLQVDLAFAPAQDFGAKAPTFKLVFGESQTLPPRASPSADSIIGMAWLYSLHVRSSLARGKLWQAEYMLSGMRDQVLALACLGSGLPTSEGRGFDQLPAEFLCRMESGLPTGLDLLALRAAWRAVSHELICKVELARPELAEKLRPTLLELMG